MASSKIPKVWLKPAPVAVVKTESKSNDLPRSFLRRRSKSASDLRATSSRNVIASSSNKVILKQLNSAQKPVARIGQKRLALESIGEENKPKVMKVKIPDWDYKSRFLDLQKKHTVLQEKARDYEVTVPVLKQQVQALHADNTTKQEQLKQLQESERNLIQEKVALEETLGNLKTSCQSLQVENENHLQKLAENTKMIKEYESKIASLSCNVRKLETKNKKLEAKTGALIKQNETLEKLTSQLQQDLVSHEELRRALHNTIQDLKGNIRVFCRVRPPVSDAENEKELCPIFFPSELNLEIRRCRESVSSLGGRVGEIKQEFTFDKVFPPEVPQKEVFEELSHLVQSALDGYHVCVFAYGQTGSGKTFTMQGTSENPGMIPRTVDLIFEKIAKLSSAGWNYSVEASFLEIYNENIRDLLEPKSAQICEARYNEGKGVVVTNLTTLSISSATELRRHMEQAHKNRVVGATNFNEHSSRSHAVTKISLGAYNTISGVKYSGSINLVDLAGSESAKTSTGDRLIETKSINKSLSTLGNVMLALHNKDPHIPYRNSKLTFLLQSSLGGNSKTLMFVNISPFDECFAESVNSLRFASKVKEVKISARRNKAFVK